MANTLQGQTPYKRRERRSLVHSLLRPLLTLLLHTMKITILTSGSRGDTQPYIALALALMSDGHDVRLATEQRVQPLIEEFGVPYFRVAGDPTAVLNDPEAQLMLRNNEV